MQAPNRVSGGSDHEWLHSTMCDLTVRRNIQPRQKETKKKYVCLFAYVKMLRRKKVSHAPVGHHIVLRATYDALTHNDIAPLR